MIFTFICIIIVVIGCTLSTLFVRWIYKRRLRKKVDTLREKHRQEDQEKREREQELNMIAQRSTISKALHPTTGINNEMGKTVSSHHYNPTTHIPIQSVWPKASHVAAQKSEALPAPLVPSQVNADTVQKTRTTMLPMEPKALAKVVNQIDKIDAYNRSNQSAFKEVVIGHRNEPDIQIQSDSVKNSKNSIKRTEANNMEEKRRAIFTRASKERSVIQRTHDDKDMKEYPKQLPVDTNTEKENEDCRKKAKNNEKEKKLVEKIQDHGKKKEISPIWDGSCQLNDFPYYKGQWTMAKMTTTELSNSSQIVLGSTRSNSTQSDSPINTQNESKIKIGLKNKQPKQHNVYELRRIAEEQAGMKETEKAYRLVKNRRQRSAGNNDDAWEKVKEEPKNLKRIPQLYNVKTLSKSTVSAANDN